MRLFMKVYYLLLSYLVRLNAENVYVDSNLFVVVDKELDFEAAKYYCNNKYNGLANIYDPNENNMLIQLLNVNFVTGAFIAYYKQGSKWQWQSNVSSNPMLWLQSPFTEISTNIEDLTTNCVYISRYGWRYTQCSNNHQFVCETRDHSPQFIESDAFMLSKQKLNFNDARSLCRSRFGYDLATIYDEEEYINAQTLCSQNTKNQEDTNCWFGYQEDTNSENENEWQWIQNIPANVIPINELINTELWTITPWQISTADILCQASYNLTISYASDGENFNKNASGSFSVHSAIRFEAIDITYNSKLRFTVNSIANVLPGLKCSIYFENNTYNTIPGDSVYFSLKSYDNTSRDIITKAHTTTYDDNQLVPGIDNNAKWIWNVYYSNKTLVLAAEEIIFEFSFKYVKDIQNKPSDNCASISYYPPYKWKTTNCQQKLYFICNKYEHKPTFKVSYDDKFALLTDRTLTQSQSTVLCNNIYGYGLATIYSYYEFTQINKLLTQYNIGNAWIGLYHNNETFIDSNNMDNNYGWQTESFFIFDEWTNNVWNTQLFPQLSINDSCVQQTNESKWQTVNCNIKSYAICNFESHSPQFISSQLGSFYLLQNQLHNYMNGEQICRDYVGKRSTGAIIYHPIENERAIWACSNSTNGKGCFIGYNNIKYRNNTYFRWRNGAMINVFEYPWFGNPFLNVSNNILKVDGYNYNASCTAIIKDNITNEWGWSIVDCENELNILCDSGDDHSQCWMLQNCAQCALRSDCSWCGDRCILTEEMCYSDQLIQQEFGCDDYNPIINITYTKNYNYSFTINVTLCPSIAPENIHIRNLKHYVNYSNCVINEGSIELYIDSDYQDAKYGNYDIFGKVIELKQSSINPGSDRFENITIFEKQPACDIRIRHGWVRSITCDAKGAGYQNNVTQFDTLHDVLRYLLPRLQHRLFEGWDIPEDNLFGYSTMNRSYNFNPHSYDHSIHRKFAKDSIINQRYANSTSDLLWEHRYHIESQQTVVKHVSFDMVHVFAHIPHHNDSQQFVLFTWCGYELELINQQNISSSKIESIKKQLYKISNLQTKNYTFDEWKGIRPMNTYSFTDPIANNEQKRRLQILIAAEVEEFCCQYHELSGPKDQEIMLEIWGFQLWVSQIIETIHSGYSFLDLLKQAGGFEHNSKFQPKPLSIVKDIIELDAAINIAFGFGWEWLSEGAGGLGQESEEIVRRRRNLMQTNIPTTTSTLNPTKKPTKNPIQKPTKNPTQKPTQNPTQKPTENPTTTTTQTPTKKSTENPTTSPSTVPTEKEEDEDEDEESNSGSMKDCPIEFQIADKLLPFLLSANQR
eukprot:159703_1